MQGTGEAQSPRNEDQSVRCSLVFLLLLISVVLDALHLLIMKIISLYSMKGRSVAFGKTDITKNKMQSVL